MNGLIFLSRCPLVISCDMFKPVRKHWLWLMDLIDLFKKKYLMHWELKKIATASITHVLATEITQLIHSMQCILFLPKPTWRP